MLKSAIDSELIRLHRGYVLNQAFRYGKLWAVCGPIAFDDVDPTMLPHLPYQKGEVIQWVEQNRREFTVYMASA